MRILLIGNFAPPYDDESLYNFSLLNRLKEEGNDCCVINTSVNPSVEKEFIDSRKFFDFVLKLLRYAWKKDVIHLSSKAYTRPALLKLIASALFGRLFRLKTIITFHSELFAVIGRQRSRVVGEPALRLTTFMAHKIICSDKDTCEVTTIFKTKENFELIPLFINFSENMKENESSALKKLKNKKRVIVFSNVRYPSLIFDVLNNMLAKHFNTDTGIAVSFSEKLPAKLQHVIEETGKRLAENLVFIESDNMKMLTMAYSKANLIIRPLSCDGKEYYSDFAIVARKPIRSKNCVYFPSSLLLVKEGKMSDTCASLINDLLKEEPETVDEKEENDFYAKLKNFYMEK